MSAADAGLTGKRGEVYEHLEAVMYLYREAGEEEAEEEVLDIMDRVSGWCSPHRLVRFADE